MCGHCSSWHQASCVGQGDTEYKFLATGGKQGFRWFCEGCKYEVSQLLRGGDASGGLGDSIEDTVATVMTETFQKFRKRSWKGWR